MKVVRFWFVTLAALVVFVFAAGSLAAEDVPKEVLDIRKSVVRVLCFDGDDVFSGSGFAIGKDEPITYIVTNHHVIENNPDRIQVLRAKNLLVNATVYVDVPYSDLCVLKLEEPLYGIPPVVLFDEKIAEAGEAVYSLGYPAAADYLSDSATGEPEDVTITDGIISAVKSLTLYEGVQPVKLLQINAAINPGNSGGPLVSKSGQILGINTYSAIDSQDINAAISVTELTGILKQKGIAYLSSSSATKKPGATINWLLVALIALGIVVVAGVVFLVIFKVKRRSGKGMKLREYVKQLGGKIPFDLAVKILKPAIDELADLHNRGRLCLDVCPENIVINRLNQAHIVPSQKRAGAKELNPGYSAPEQYKTNGQMGPWTDVYSITAVLFFMVTGKEPQAVFERLMGPDTVIEQASKITDDANGVIVTGLALHETQRTQNVLVMMKALGLHFVSTEFGALPNKPIYQRERKKINPRKVALLACTIGLPVLLISFFAYLQIHYAAAEAFVDQQQYDAAHKELKMLPILYRDANRLNEFIIANIELNQYQNFTSAKLRFTRLQDYRDSNKLITEVDYQNALYCLNTKAFDQARTMFKSLGDYKDSKDLLLEVDFQEALNWVKDGKYAEAHVALKNLAKLNYKNASEQLFDVECKWAQWMFDSGDYDGALGRLKASDNKGAPEKYQEMQEQIYQKGIQCYHEANYSAYYDATSIFSVLGQYKRSADYLTLCNAQRIEGRGYDVAYRKKIYNELNQLGSFEDANELTENDIFIYYKLEGYWSDGTYYFSLKINIADQETQIRYNLPFIVGEYYNIENKSIYVGDVGSWNRSFDIKFINDYMISVFCVKNGHTYYLEKR